MKSMTGGAETRPKRATIVDVARHAGVSTASASKVLRNAYGVSDAMRDRVQASMEALSYRPNRPARGMRGRTFTIGMMVSDIDNPFFSLIADGISSAIRTREYELLISPGGYSAATQNAAVDALTDHQMDGLILVAPVIPGSDLERAAQDIPLAIVGRHSQSGALDSVSTDDMYGADLVVDHLVGLGHRRIGFVANLQDLLETDRPESVRLEGFLQAMRRRGLEKDAIVIDSRWSLEGGRAAVHEIDALADPPTAVFAGADVAALGMISELWDRREAVPETYSLVGFDNSRLSSLGPIDLTTVDQSGFEMGQNVGRLLLERIEGRPEPQHVLMRPELVIRSTTAAAPV